MKLCATTVLLLWIMLPSGRALADDVIGRDSARHPFSVSFAGRNGILHPESAVDWAGSTWASMLERSLRHPVLIRCLNVESDQSALSKKAVSVESVYTGEVFSNTRGGIITSGATQYAGLLDLRVTADFEEMGVPLPGRLVILAQNTHGRGLTDDFVGDAQFISNIDSSDNIMQVSEYWWEFGLFNDTVTVRLGKQDLNTSFLVMNLAQDFVQASFGLSPSAGFPSFPDPSMAAVVLADLTPSLQMKIGIWDALPDRSGWGFSGNDVTLSFGELEYSFVLSDARLPGTLDLGIAYSTRGEVAGQTLPSAHGYYVQFEQLIFREQECNQSDAQGLGVFASYFPRFFDEGSPTAAIKSDFVAGVVYTGLIPGRDADVVGAGVAWARLNQEGTGPETVIELFYKAQITPGLSLQPDLQYIANPSGIHRDALAFGLRFQLTL